MKLPVFDILTYEKFFGEDHQRNHWTKFFNFFGKEYKILDFGCGAGWSIKIGRDLGYDIVGLDTTNIAASRHEKFNEFRKALGVHEYIKLYDGIEKLPFEDDSFSLIVCRASFNKYHVTNKNEKSKLALERLNEFSRILTGPRIVVITGKYFKNEFKQFDFQVYNWDKKEIKQLWSHSGS
jgi:SAM-dependent methyltransferase